MSIGSRQAKARTKVFLSYSRKDRDSVGRIAFALEAHDGIQVFKDTEDILPTEEWRNRLGGLIGEADTIIFCLSPDSATSEVCAWEVAVAERLNKRIAPIVIRDVDGRVPGGLAKLNYIFATARDDFDKAMARLVSAIDTDIVWIREHTRVGELARRWAENGEQTDQLLRGRELEAVEQWASLRPSNAPELTATAARFIAVSRLGVTTATRRARRTKALVGTLAASVVGIAGLAYVGILNPAYMEGLHNQVRNRLTDASLKQGDVKRDCPSEACPEMVVLPPGEYSVGASRMTKDQEKIIIAKPFLVSKYEVTFAEWDACYDSGGCLFQPGDEGWGRGSRPVINVSWDDVQQYLKWLSTKTGMNYRLLTGPEWEFAAYGVTDARAFRPELFAYESGRRNANCHACGSEWDDKQTAPVGSFMPNAFGLYDMIGNVWEWALGCEDKNGYATAPKDGSVASTIGNCMRGIRGSSWKGSLGDIAPGVPRLWEDPDARRNFIGFRVARTH